MRRVRPGGFTLLEVLGAVAILGIASASFVTASIESIERSSLARGGLAASLQADNVLAELQRSAANGGVVPGETTREEDGFTIHIAIRPADLGALGLGALLERERGEPEASILTGDPAPALLLAEITVSWGEERREQSVERSTFLFDPSAHPDVQALAPQTGTAES